MNIYVGNLSYNATDEQLKDLFSQYGEVVSATIITDKFTGKPRGFAFVEMASGSEGQAAIDALNGQDFDGRTLNINEARARESRPPRRNNNRF